MGVLTIDVQDSGSGFTENDIEEGHGLDMLRKRLTTIFDDSAKLEIRETGQVRLEIHV